MALHLHLQHSKSYYYSFFGQELRKWPWGSTPSHAFSWYDWKGGICCIKYHCVLTFTNFEFISQLTFHNRIFPKYIVLSYIWLPPEQWSAHISAKCRVGVEETKFALRPEIDFCSWIKTKSNNVDYIYSSRLRYL